MSVFGLYTASTASQHVQAHLPGYPLYPDVPDASAETKDDEEPGKSGDSSSDSEGQQNPSKSSKAEEQTGEATEEDSASDADDQQKPLSVKAKGQARAAKARGPNSTRQWKEYNQWSRSDNTDAEIMAFIRADLADLNKKAGITSLPPRHYDRKRGNIYGDWMYRHTWSTNKGYMQNTTLLCPLVERCGCPCEAKIEETTGQFVLYIHAEHTAADHKDDSSRYLSVYKQDFVLKAVKTAPMNTASELIKCKTRPPSKSILS